MWVVAAREHTGEQPRLEMGFHSSEHGEGALMGSVRSAVSVVIFVIIPAGVEVFEVWVVDVRYVYRGDVVGGVHSVWRAPW